ncbi:hypothetical protein MAPG_10315 [Magnaporthiopsis poae ATCC 64411]|uniref:Uncharacterized protein n=1 Tax=Magnaporthiopsis poae (strain ATCC 64411 / 73-15) TaxID=644358 RepID=A0A0C4ECA0_MAGP6|nr:hypothetical protein MAPG_10315 [Magnaporthiopsis poae ATCC 64411]
MAGRASAPSDTQSTCADSWSLVDDGETIDPTSASHAVRFPHQAHVLDFDPSAPAKTCGHVAAAASRHQDAVLYGADGCSDIDTPSLSRGSARAKARSSESENSSSDYSTGGVPISPLAANGGSGGNRPRSHSNPPRSGSESPGAIRKRLFLQELGRRGVAFSEPNPYF